MSYDCESANISMTALTFCSHALYVLMITLPPFKLLLMTTLEPPSFATISRRFLAVTLVTFAASIFLPIAAPLTIFAVLLRRPVDLGQAKAFRHFEENVYGVVDAAEEFGAGALGEDGDVGEGVHALVGGGGEGAV